MGRAVRLSGGRACGILDAAAAAAAGLPVGCAEPGDAEAEAATIGDREHSAVDLDDDAQIAPTQLGNAL